ncbi:MAG: hypothetical protein L7U83_07825 [Akkermansiaceae bacterium]|nr:hypothetical protein [Akkermansiaceae bacterium]
MPFTGQSAVLCGGVLVTQAPDPVIEVIDGDQEHVIAWRGGAKRGDQEGEQ